MNRRGFFGLSAAAAAIVLGSTGTKPQAAVAPPGAFSAISSMEVQQLAGAFVKVDPSMIPEEVWAAREELEDYANHKLFTTKTDEFSMLRSVKPMAKQAWRREAANRRASVYNLKAVMIDGMCKAIGIPNPFSVPASPRTRW